MSDTKSQLSDSRANVSESRTQMLDSRANVSENRPQMSESRPQTIDAKSEVWLCLRKIIKSTSIEIVEVCNLFSSFTLF
jgi:hypothetical protein